MINRKRFDSFKKKYPDVISIESLSEDGSISIINLGTVIRIQNYSGKNNYYPNLVEDFNNLDDKRKIRKIN